MFAPCTILCSLIFTHVICMMRFPFLMLFLPICISAVNFLLIKLLSNYLFCFKNKQAAAFTYQIYFALTHIIPAVMSGERI